MKLFLFSDIHASFSQLKKLSRFLLKKSSDFDALIFCGDFVNMGQPVNFADEFAAAIDRIKLPFLWVSGNNDFGLSFDRLNNRYPVLDHQEVELAGHRFVGVGGRPDEELEGPRADTLDNAILLSHYPPVKTSSQPKALTHCPRVHICGHIHQVEGLKYVGSTKVVKLGAFVDGHCGIIDLPTLKARFYRIN